MIKFKIEGKEYSCPTSWKDVTVKQFQELKAWDKKDFIKLLSIITGVEYSIIFKTSELDVDTKLLPFLEFLKKPLDVNNLPAVSFLTIEGKQYDIPKNLDRYSFGQKIDATNAINDAIEKTGDVYNYISKVVAIYMQPIVQNRDYKTTEAVEFKSVIDKCSIVEAYTVASFFFRTFGVFSKEKPKPWYRRLMQNKKQQESIS